MALKIDEQSADALTFRIAEGIHSITRLYFGLYISDFKWAESVGLSLPESLNGRLLKICGDGGLAEFLYGQISYKLDEDESFDPGETDELGDAESYKDALGAAKELVSELSALPYSYRLVSPLPSSFSQEFFELCEDFELGAGVSIVRGSKLQESFPLKTGVTARDSRISNSVGEGLLVPPNEESLYLCSREVGTSGDKMKHQLSLTSKHRYGNFSARS